MRKSLFGIAWLLMFLCSAATIAWKPVVQEQTQFHAFEDTLYHNYVKNIYDSAGLAGYGLELGVFEKAMTGYLNLKNSGQLSLSKPVLSIVDFDQSSTRKRLWIIDLEKKELLMNTWVAHGQRSGADVATSFSNNNNSLQSSVGFYVTAETYYGQHGISLKLDGMDEGFNSNARSRSIVVHGAAYVGQQSIQVLGRLGRSQGCPAVPAELAGSIIHTIQGKTVLFINANDGKYSSRYLNEHQAAMLAMNTASMTKVADSV
ncbi:murein L,D-transpeptidase catalytic domain family protein [Pedobacter nutrimenti]|uniref:L,D-transpeptidase-like protein n=1 Tax=Pedobacter nutrimenti TaxID=1241337 RepID=A0A318ULV4_9SPHI|nr:murein L,D-transpeptidase catalytic domain family protein [Pedobacter nutrimenti]PYF77372.1 L,D-transpeptidase-like protein [Pedobacter nutrimenti]